ncbi:probable plastid-lipid-associated protein 13, chloroplastic [Humulus lupulus]|uniref:probable plastid-lipid-associated protein 13, chloroplastic n=1 Tax=Humulus lupulus TaxID=3486 RepID=UPI002B408911|nr:probable plastid-lipid-associated protein 13, chloroplastic [Humulus lupulus]
MGVMVLAAVGLRRGSTRGSTTVLYQLSVVSTIRSCCLLSSSVSSTTTSLSMFRRLRRRLTCRAMVQQAIQGGAPTGYAKELERLSTKESLLLAFKDSGGFEALIFGKMSDLQRIDVNGRITGLEQLNLTPLPMTSPFLEGRWSFEWFGSGSPGLFAAKFIFKIFPSNLANLSKMDMVIKDGYARVTTNMRVLNSIETKFTLSTKLTVEGTLRMREEYAGGVFETLKVIEETVPEQLKGALGQAVNTIQQLPVPVRDAFTGGLRGPLSGTFQRLFMISYLDDEILVHRWLWSLMVRISSKSLSLSLSLSLFSSDFVFPHREEGSYAICSDQFQMEYFDLIWNVHQSI